MNTKHRAPHAVRRHFSRAALGASGCYTPYIGDGFCAKDCNVAKCEFDQGDCASP